MRSHSTVPDQVLGPPQVFSRCRCGCAPTSHQQNEFPGLVNKPGSLSPGIKPRLSVPHSFCVPSLQPRVLAPFLPAMNVCIHRQRLPGYMGRLELRKEVKLRKGKNVHAWKGAVRRKGTSVPRVAAGTNSLIPFPPN